MTTSQTRRVNVITRQRLLSDDFNNTGRMFGRSDALHTLAAGLGNAYLDNALGKGGVIGGFMVEAIPGTNRIRVAPGLGLVESTPTSPTFDPPVAVLELMAEVEIDLTAHIDPGSPRLVVIEIEPAEATLVTGVVDVFDPGTGTFGFDPTAARVVGSSPILSVNAGAAAANPVVPTGPSGKLPLAVVKLVAAQASFADAYASVLMCRPLLFAESGHIASPGSVRGGGVSVGEESGGALVNLTNCYLNRMSCSLLGLEAEVQGLIAFATRGRTPDTTDVAATLASRAPVYAYAVAPPWRSTDYGTIAPREAWQRNPNQIAFASAQNIVGGSGSTFISLAAETATSPGLTLRNAIVIWDSLAPVGAERGAGNAPIEIVNARGPHPEHAPGGSGGLPLDLAQDPTWGNSQSPTDSVYIGSVAALNVSSSFMGQATSNAYVASLDKVDPLGGGAAARRPFFSSAIALADVAFYPGRFPTMLVGDTEIIPAHAEAIQLYYAWGAGAGAGNPAFGIKSELGYGRSDPGAVAYGGAGGRVDATTVANYEVSGTTTLKRSAAASLRASQVIAAGGTALVMVFDGYVDPFLAAR